MNLRRLCFVTILATTLWVLESHSQVNKPDGSWITYQSHNYFLSNCFLQVKHDQNSWIFLAAEHSKTQFQGFWPTEPGHYRVSSAVIPDNNVVMVDQEPAEVLEELDILFAERQGRLQPVSYTYIKNPDDPNRETKTPVCTGLSL